jgi:hypothetical protein
MIDCVLVKNGILFLYSHSVLKCLILKNGRAIIEDEPFTFCDQYAAFHYAVT